MDAHVGRALEQLHAQVVDEPLPEWLEGASCWPAVKHLAHLALRTADARGSVAQWRAWLHRHVPDVPDELVDEAERCMREAGLWPWRR